MSATLRPSWSTASCRPSPLADLDAYLAAGGGPGARRRPAGRARRRSIDEIEASGLRGRGGAGFPTGHQVADRRRQPLARAADHRRRERGRGRARDLQGPRHPARQPVRTCSRAPSSPPAPSGPATSWSRSRTASSRQELDRVRRGHRRDRARPAGCDGRRRAVVIEGPDEYLFGEETALLEVVDGRAAVPPHRPAVPPGRRSRWSSTTTTSTTEQRRWPRTSRWPGPAHETPAPPGAGRQRRDAGQRGRHRRRGRRLVPAASAPTSRPARSSARSPATSPGPGVGEVAAGHDRSARRSRPIGGGPGAGPAGQGGRSTVCRPRRHARRRCSTRRSPTRTWRPSAAGSGTASFIVVDDGTDMTAVAAGVARFLAVESCGQCTPCKQDGLAHRRRARPAVRGRPATQHDLDGWPPGARHRRRRCPLQPGPPAAGRGRRRSSTRLGRRGRPPGHRPPPGRRSSRYLVAEVDAIDDEGDVALDERRRTKQPDWTYDVDAGRAPTPPTSSATTLRHEID